MPPRGAPPTPARRRPACPAAPGAPARTRPATAATRARPRAARRAARVAVRVVATCTSPSASRATSTSRARGRTVGRARAAARRPGRAGSRRSAARRGCGARAARPGPSLVDGQPHPVPPAQRAAGQLLHRRPAARSRPAGCSCSASTVAFSARCAAGSTCCRSQPPQPPARAQPHGAGTRSGDGAQHRDRVGPAERAAAVLVDDRAHPLARQRVPHEHHPPVVAGHAVPAVRDRRRPRSSRTRSVQSRSLSGRLAARATGWLRPVGRRTGGVAIGRGRGRLVAAARRARRRLRAPGLPAAPTTPAATARW